MGKTVSEQDGRVLQMRKELVRKSLHVLIAFIPLIVRISPGLAITLLGAGSAVYCLSEYIRLTKKQDDIHILRSFDPIMSITEFVSRGNEKTGFMKAPLMLALGALLSILLFEHDALRIGIFALAFGDTAAALIGTSYPIRKLSFLPKKSIGGVFGCFTATLVSAYVVTGSLENSLIIAAVATIVESLPLGDFDNVLIPVSVGWVASLLI